MKRVLVGASAIAMMAASAQAGGIDRSGQGIGVLFEKGRYAEFSLGYVTPDVSGNDVALFGGFPSGDVARSYTQLSFSYKADLSDRISYAVILDQPFGADVRYPTFNGTTGSIALGGTIAKAEAIALTGLLRYKIDDNVSVHGGIRVDRGTGNITLNGAAYGPLAGYNVKLDHDVAAGFVIGAAYEIPEIAMRVAVTYNSAITHDFDTVESLNPALTSNTKVKLPQSINLDFQTGIAQNTLLFGSVRWVNWSQFRIDPVIFTGVAGGGLVDLENTTTYTLGIGRKFNDSWSGAASILYEGKGDNLVSPLAPTNGKLGLTLAAIYTRDNMKITTGINYTKLGNAKPETGTPDTARADFKNNEAIGIGVKVGFTF
jgi:long-subunit fatty acid transport protein